MLSKQYILGLLTKKSEKTSKDKDLHGLLFFI
jgi:hypothetical protein